MPPSLLVCVSFAALLAAFGMGATRVDQAWGPWWLAASGLLWILAWRAAERRGLGVRALLVGFVLLRIVAWLAAPESSGDANRYAWEAEVWLAGSNPYVHAPESPALAKLAGEHPELFQRVEHRSIPAAYPPLAQALFVVATLGARGLTALGVVPLDVAREGALRALALAGDLGVLLALLRWFARERRAHAALVLWAWSPLVALEFAGAGHFDALGIALAVLALTPEAASTRRPDARAASLARASFLAAAAAIKLLPAAFAPFAVRDAAPRAAGGRRRSGFELAWFAVLLVLLSAPMLWSWGSTRSASGLGTYATTWESTSVVFRAFERPLWPLLPVGEGRLNAKLAARALVIAAWIALALRLVRRRADAAHAAFVLTGAFLVLSPTFHPWYAAWIAPWLVLRVSRPSTPDDGAGRRPRLVSAAFLWLLATSPLQYVLLVRWRAAGEWSEPPWLWPLMFAPFLCLLLLAVPPVRRR